MKFFYILAIFFVITCASAQYSIMDIGTLGGSGSQAFGLNNFGQVTGSATVQGGSNHGFRWENGNMTDLGNLGGQACYAMSINGSNRIAGYADLPDGRSSAFLWAGGAMSALNVFGASESWAYDVNNNNVIAGAYRNGDITRGYIWQNGVATDLGSLGGYDTEGHAISQAGQVVGSSTTSQHQNGHGFLWQNGVMTDVGTLGGSWSEAWGINSSTQVVGRTQMPNLALHAFLWQSGQIMDLNVPGDSVALSVNNSSQIVGFTELPTTERAFIWQNGQFHFLDDLVVGSGWSLISAWHINDLGQVVGAGNHGGQIHAYLLTPVPEPATIGILGLGLLAFVRRRR